MVEIEVREVPETFVAVIREVVVIEDLPAFFGRAFHTVAEAIEAQGLHPVGPPFGLYRGMPETSIDVAAGFPVNAPMRPYGKVMPDELPAGLAVVAMHVGPFDTMVQTYAEMQGWMAEREMFPGDVVWESYLTDPSVEPNPENWQTEIVWPVAQAMIVM